MHFEAHSTHYRTVHVQVVVKLLRCNKCLSLSMSCIFDMFHSHECFWCYFHVVNVLGMFDLKNVFHVLSLREVLVFCSFFSMLFTLSLLCDFLEM